MAKAVYYSGDVQGVGFRATASRIARLHPAVSGWVRNLADGRVELFAGGPAEEVAAFLAAVRDRMTDHISAEDVAERESDERLIGFRVVS